MLILRWRQDAQVDITDLCRYCAEPLVSRVRPAVTPAYAVTARGAHAHTDEHTVATHSDNYTDEHACTS